MEFKPERPLHTLGNPRSEPTCTQGGAVCAGAFPCPVEQSPHPTGLDRPSCEVAGTRCLPGGPTEILGAQYRIVQGPNVMAILYSTTSGRNGQVQERLWKCRKEGPLLQAQQGIEGLGERRRENRRRAGTRSVVKKRVRPTFIHHLFRSRR